MKAESAVTPLPGALVLVVLLASLAFSVWLFASGVRGDLQFSRARSAAMAEAHRLAASTGADPVPRAVEPQSILGLAPIPAVLTSLVVFVTALVLMFGFFVVNPNEARVLTLFGTYKGSVLENGFYWTNPFMSKKKVSRRARNLNGERIKVNDLAGNPIEIAAVVVWRVKDTYRATFEVDDYNSYVVTQSEAAVRHLAGTYPYDGHSEDPSHPVVSLRAGREQVAEVLERELQARVQNAGVEIIESRLSHLAYAPEIAGAMLQRQQADAVVSARTRIVDGAVGMVKLALERLDHDKIVELDVERRAAMVSNLLVVLCAHEGAQPVLNAGTLYT